MPLGDSLTDGYNIPGGYRICLAERFADDDVAFDFVGSLSNGPPRLRDREHEGHSGFRIDEIAASVDDWLGRYRPDIVLLMIGTNDMVQGDRLGTAPERLGDLVDEIAATAPTSHVIVASIPQMGGSPYAERIEAFNADVPDVVGARIDEGEQVSYVDMYSVIEASDLHTDYTHMNENGNCKLAEAWYVAIGVVLELPIGAGPPRRRCGTRVVPYPKPMLRTLTASGAGLLAALVVPSVPAFSAADQPATAPPGTLAWGPCDEEEGLTDVFESATLTVPLDYDDPAGATIDIALIRYPAEESIREGAILLNPGGPGGSGFDFAAAAAEALDFEMGLGGRFDIIGFDPRGVDRSGESTASTIAPSTRCCTPTTHPTMPSRQR